MYHITGAVPTFSAGTSPHFARAHTHIHTNKNYILQLNIATKWQALVMAPALARGERLHMPAVDSPRGDGNAEAGVAVGSKGSACVRS